MKPYTILLNDNPITNGFMPYREFGGDYKQCVPSDYEAALTIGWPTYRFLKGTMEIIVNHDKSQPGSL